MATWTNLGSKGGGSKKARKKEAQASNKVYSIYRKYIFHTPIHISRTNGHISLANCRLLKGASAQDTKSLLFFPGSSFGKAPDVRYEGGDVGSGLMLRAMHVAYDFVTMSR